MIILFPTDKLPSSWQNKGLIMGRFPVENSQHNPMFGHTIPNELWEELFLIVPHLLLPCQTVHPKEFTPILYEHLYLIMQYATETQLTILADSKHPRNFDQMLDNRNKKMVTHFITCVAICTTVNSLASIG